MRKSFPAHLFRTLRARLFMLWGASLALMTVVIVISVFTSVYNVESASWRSRQDEAAQYAARSVSNFLAQIQLTMGLLADFGRDELLNNPALLDTLLERNPALIELAYVDPAGQILKSASQGQPLIANLFTIPQSEWFRRARSGERYYSRIQISDQGEPYLLYSIPVPRLDGASGPINDVLVARIRMIVLSQVVSGIHFGQAGRAYIVNRQGQVIAHSDRQLVSAMVSIGEQPEFAAILQSPRQRWYGSARSLNSQAVLIASAAVEDTGWIVLTELPSQEAFANSRMAAVQLSLQLLAFTVLFGMYLARRVNRLFIYPIQLLREAALRLGQGDLDYKALVVRRDELGEVAEAFNTMAVSINASRQALERVNDELESRVRERTYELTELNRALSGEVEERTQAERRALASLKEKEILLKEIHHRVKNNLQIISSLLSMQSRKIQDPGVSFALQESQNRVRSMSLIHEKLYQSGGLAQIDLSEYIRSLAAFLARSYHSASMVEVVVRVLPGEPAPGEAAPGSPLEAGKPGGPAIWLDLDSAVPCGLILNELLSNAYKYAFPNNRPGRLEITLQKRQAICIRVADDGVGLPEQFDFNQLGQKNSLGLQLVKSLVDQLDGQIWVEANQPSGACFMIEFPSV
ncbi:MAG: histidine kinase dimerization/phosphoacceptor domain -containing protein [Chloroflexota bacterium]